MYILMKQLHIYFLPPSTTMFKFVVTHHGKRKTLTLWMTASGRAGTSPNHSQEMGSSDRKYCDNCNIVIISLILVVYLRKLMCSEVYSEEVWI